MVGWFYGVGGRGGFRAYDENWLGLENEEGFL
jgi:hypothetical protein